MQLINKSSLFQVEAYIRLFGDIILEKGKDYSDNIVLLDLPDCDNEYGDSIVRLGNKIYISESEIGKLGLSEIELFAAISHELGHILYHTTPWGNDSESRADTFAAELGLCRQMISVIEKIIASRRYRNMTTMLVQRIQFLQHLA